MFLIICWPLYSYIARSKYLFALPLGLKNITPIVIDIAEIGKIGNQILLTLSELFDVNQAFGVNANAHNAEISGTPKINELN